MPECECCSTTLTALAYQCNFCGLSFCGEHRLPEKHDCLALKLSGRSVFSSAEEKFTTSGASDSFDTGDFDYDDWIEHVREGSMEESRTQSPTTQEIRDALRKETTEATENRIETTAEHISDEITSPSERPYSVFEPELTVGTRPDPEFESSPDVNPDGSLSEPSELDDAPVGVPEKRSITRWVFWLLLLLVAAGVVYFLYL